MNAVALTFSACTTSTKVTQYAAFAFGQQCETLGARPSMGSRGDDYALADTINGLNTLF